MVSLAVYHAGKRGREAFQALKFAASHRLLNNQTQ